MTPKQTHNPLDTLPLFDDNGNILPLALDVALPWLAELMDEYDRFDLSHSILNNSRRRHLVRGAMVDVVRAMLLSDKKENTR